MGASADHLSEGLPSLSLGGLHRHRLTSLQAAELTTAAKGTKTKVEVALENSQKIDESIAALQVLGYNKKEIEKAFDKLVKENMSTEELIRKGLSILGK